MASGTPSDALTIESALGCGGARFLLNDKHLGRGGCRIHELCRGPHASLALQEIDVDVTRVVNPDAALLQQLAEWLAQLVVDCRATLRSLRLAGPLPLASIFEPMAPYAAEFKLLEQAYLSRGGNEWQPMAAACTLHLLPSLKRVEFRFSFSEMSPPQDLLARLLSPAAPLAPLGVQQLQHLAMVFPVRSMAQPTVQLPDAMSLLTQLTSLKIKRMPVAAETHCLGALTSLRHLLWDPALAVDIPYAVPLGLEQLTRLEVLWLVTECPLELPTSLAGTLEGLHVIGRTFKKELRHLQRWDWLQDFNQLRGLRLQGLGIAELPPEIADKSQLTRLDLMCNHLEMLPDGPYLSELRHVHLGNNHLEAFPSALLRASKLESLFLSHQFANETSSSGPSSGASSGRLSPVSSSTPGTGLVRSSIGATQRMDFSHADVKGLLGLRHLHTIVMETLQPVVRRRSNAPPRDFSWLQAVLKRKLGCRLTGEELAYQLESKNVFELAPLDLDGCEPAGSTAGDSDSDSDSDGLTAPSQRGSLRRIVSYERL
ncbi:hypothetical protein D9Q98_003243 [Chlorella vulgaris]|uniref:Uncharacterized protein n=1 Tax=Chlorella vulgaris TaxID=3077 RepID=A0A9D4YYK9_CHLVU|nr:hypothetical protein D9Q98_003243 [Chlorella vulgaris]